MKFSNNKITKFLEKAPQILNGKRPRKLQKPFAQLTEIKILKVAKINLEINKNFFKLVLHYQDIQLKKQFRRAFPVCKTLPGA